MSLCIWPLAGHGDLKLEWLDADHQEILNFIQSKMEAGVAFHIIDPNSKAKKPPLVAIESTDQITGHQVYIRDPDIKGLVEAGLAEISSIQFTGVGELKTSGRAKSAKEVAENDTVAVAPKQGG